MPNASKYKHKTYKTDKNQTCLNYVKELTKLQTHSTVNFRL